MGFGRAAVYVPLARSCLGVPAIPVIGLLPGLFPLQACPLCPTETHVGDGDNLWEAITLCLPLSSSFHVGEKNTGCGWHEPRFADRGGYLWRGTSVPRSCPKPHTEGLSHLALGSNNAASRERENLFVGLEDRPSSNKPSNAQCYKAEKEPQCYYTDT